MTDKKIDDFLNTFKEENDFLALINDNGMNDFEHSKYHALIKLIVFDIKAAQYFNGHLRLTEKGIEIIKKGGWIEYNKHLDEKERIEFKKSKADLTLVEKTLKEFPRTKFLSWAGFIIGLCLAILELYKYIKQLK